MGNKPGHRQASTMPKDLSALSGDMGPPAWHTGAACSLWCIGAGPRSACRLALPCIEEGLLQQASFQNLFVRLKHRRTVVCASCICIYGHLKRPFVEMHIELLHTMCFIAHVGPFVISSGNSY